MLPQLERTNSINNYSKIGQRYSLNPFIDYSASQYIKKNRNSSVCQFLHSVRKQMQQSKVQEFNDHKKKQTIAKKGKHRQASILNRQKRILYFQTELNQKQNKKYEAAVNETIQKIIQNTQLITVGQINTIEKPPHRYKTRLCIDNHKIYLYGGIGGQKNIKWAELNLNTKKWVLPNQVLNRQDKSLYHPNIPIYGHSFTSFKGKGFVYGGISNDIMNDLTIFNIQTYELKQGAICKYRRKQHAATMIGKFMFVHGGIEDGQTKNNMYYYDTEFDCWGYFYSNSQLPSLSHHSMTSSYSSTKSKRKIGKLTEIIDSLYIFGGKTTSGQASNRLFKISINNQMAVISIQIKFDQIGPEKRFSCCFHSVSSNYLLVYGGRQNQQVTASNKVKGVFNDILLFNLQKNIWIKQQVSNMIGHRYGMASSVFDGTVYVFGGCTQQKYADGNIITMKCFSGIGNLKTSKSITTKSKLTTKKEFNGKLS